MPGDPVWRKPSGENMEVDYSSRWKAISAVFRKEARTGLRSVLYLAILLITCILTLLTAIDQFFLQYYNGAKYVLAQYFVGQVFQSTFPLLYLVILIPPAIAISEEKESGSWEMISVFKRKRVCLLAGKLLWQFTFSMILILASFLVIFGVYLAESGHLVIYELILISVYAKSTITSPGPSMYIIGRLFFSPLDIYIEYFVAIFVSFSIVLEGLLISEITKKKVTSVAVSVSLFLLVFLISQILQSSIAHGSLNQLYHIVEFINPGNMFGMAMFLSNMQPYVAASGVRPGEVFSSANYKYYATYHVSALNAIMPFSSMLLEYLILTVFILALFFIIGVKTR